MVETLSGKMQDTAQERIKAEESAKPQPGATISIYPNVNTRIRQRSVTEFLFKSGDISAKTIHSKLQPVYGNETLDIITIQIWVQCFQKGDFDIHDKERPGKPSTVRTDQYLALVEEIIVLKIGIKPSNTRNDANSEIKTKVLPFQRQNHDRDLLGQDGLIFMDMLEKILPSTRKDIDNVRPHTAQQTLAHISRYGWTLMPHPDYNPDLAPSDFYMFHKLKNYLRGKTFENDEMIFHEVRRWFRKQDVAFSQSGFVSRKERWCTEGR
ncbi:hypothetical protein LAZ67_4002270 [Cordylochernes scorpioides]|uniref:Transposase n=1 Tax=Cordylochernes scorpioides TaxID=51811 RepID=A0ABY6KCV2_9ARAC|nr:hypothetical protein LAZ67_4002270 [Cordylochernes scorpioides]